MGCAGSKANGAGQLIDPIPANGMGNVGRAYTELRAKDTKPRVSVMTGKWELDPKKLDPEACISIGEGLFGLVFEGRILEADLEKMRPDDVIPDDHSVVVVVKKVAIDKTEKRADFFKELAVMKEIDHPHVLRLVGAMTMEPPLMMIFENHAHGSLKTYLNSVRSSYSLSLDQQVRRCGGCMVVGCPVLCGCDCPSTSGVVPALLWVPGTSVGS